MRRSISSFAAIALLAAGILSVCVSDVICQPGRSVSNTGRRLDEFSKQSDKATRDELAREMNKKGPTKEELQRREALKAEIKSDLESLQNEYNAIASALRSEKPIEVSFATGLAERVHKHSSRLRQNIAFPDAEEEKQKSDGVAAAETDLRKRLRGLGLLIFEFITHPMLESLVVLNVEEAMKARKILDTLIEESGRMKPH